VLISRSTKVLLQSPGTGSVLLCLVGLSLGAVLIAAWGHAASSTARANGAAVHKTSIAAATQPAGPKPILRSLGKESLSPASLATNPSANSSQRHLNRSVFRRSIATDELGILSDYAGRPAREALKQSKVREVMDNLVPYAPFHFGRDMPLPTVLEAVLLHSSTPIVVRDGRYMMFATGDGSGNTHAFFWIDMQKGIALGGIFFHPSNGEPTPTLTLFSRQVTNGSLKMSQLPPAFVQDLSQWAAMAGVPPVTTRYFINASGEKLVLTHDEDYCKQTQGAGVASPGTCRQMKAEAADLDVQAASFLGQTHYASNATMRMASIRAADAPMTR
jgi:hypothetical protein